MGSTVQHETFYFPTGDLIIRSVADHDGVSTLFRVSKSVLAFNSPVFEGMFTLPDAGAQEKYDGAPVVSVTDTAEELADLFSALHDPNFFSYERLDPTLPLRFTPVMRIAKKYDIERVSTRVTNIILESWPQSFEDWIRVHLDINTILDTHTEKLYGTVKGKRFEERVPEPSAAIRFAREFDLPSILPMAMYTIAGIPDTAWGDSHVPNTRTVNWSLLETADLRVLSRYKTASLEFVHRIVNTYHPLNELEDTMSIESCLLQGRCVDAFSDIMADWADGPLRKEAHLDMFTSPDPLGLLQKLYATSPRWQLCRNCHKGLEDNLRGFQRVIFITVQNYPVHIRTS